MYFADSTYPVGNPADYIKEFSFGWKGMYDGGIPDATGHAILPLFIFIYGLELLSFGQVAAQAIFFFIVLFSTGAGCIALLRYFGRRYNFSENPVAIIAPTLFYMSNLYIAVNGWRTLIFLYIFYAALPTLLLLFLKYLDTEKIKYLFVYSIVTATIVAVALTNLAFLVILLGLQCLLAILYIGEKDPRRLLRLYGIAFLLWLPLNIWYLLPQLSAISQSAIKATGGGDLAGSLSILNIISSHASLLNTLSINGFYSLYDTLAGPWFSWASLYSESFFGILSLIFPFILAITLFDKNLRRHAPNLYLFGALLVVGGSFVAKGSHGPAGSLFQWLFENFPIPFLLYRAAYEKLGILIVVGYIIITYLFFTLSVKRFGIFARWISGVLVAIIVVLGFPIWTGSIFFLTSQLCCDASEG